MFLVFFINSFFLWFFSMPVLGNFFICLLEKPYLNNQIKNADSIIVLGAQVIDVKDISGYKNSLGEDGISRLFLAYRIYKKNNLPIILTGGDVLNEKSYAEVASKILTDLNVPKNKIIIENKSKDTYENAIFSKKICEKENFNRPIIISKASHLKRAEYIFQKIGFKNIFLLASSYSCQKEKNLFSFLPRDFEKLRNYLYETLGLVFYKIIY